MGKSSPSASKSTPRPRSRRRRTSSPRSPLRTKTKTPIKSPIRIKQEEDQDGTIKAFESIKGDDSSAVESVARQEPPEIYLDMDLEKNRYPGASTWAKEEERLFEILFQRSEKPLLPAHWDVDFRGVPIMHTVFRTTDDAEAIVYSCSPKEFQATTAIHRLIDLTAAVRGIYQVSLREKASLLIKKSLDRYISWAAEDGGYSHLKVVPNITTAVMDADLEEGDIITYVNDQMRALANAQREFSRKDTLGSMSDVLDGAGVGEGIGPEEEPEKIGQDEEVGEHNTPVKRGTGRVVSEQSASSRDPATETSNKSAHAAENASSSIYRYRPPVVYGLFIVRASVLLVTVDSSKGDNAYVSFHVDMHFTDRSQSVWNALTIAIAVCLARDQLMQRIADFDEISAAEGSESDA